jgi:hypothetical protein
MADSLRDTLRRSDIEAKPPNADEVGWVRTPPRSGPADPKQRVGNGLRSPEPFVDLRKTPNVTGTWFHEQGAYRLLLNHVGAHLEGLVTLVTSLFRYHTLGERDVRIPRDWGVCALDLVGKPKPIAFRIAGDLEFGRRYKLYAPVWIGKFDRAKYDEHMAIGYLEITGEDRVELELESGFRERWPEHGRLAKTHARRVDRSPVLLDRYLAGGDVPYALRTRLWFPSTPIQRHAMRHMALQILRDAAPLDENFLPRPGGEEHTIPSLLYAAKDLGNSVIERNRTNNAANAIDALVKRTFGRPLETPVGKGGFGMLHLPEMQQEVLRLLARTTMMPSPERGPETVMNALQRVLDATSPDAVDLRSIAKHLQMKPRTPTHHPLKFEFVALDLEVVDLHEFVEKLIAEIRKHSDPLIEEKLVDLVEGLEKWLGRLRKVVKYLPTSTYAGVLFVEYTPPAAIPPIRPWKARYGIVLAGVSVKRALGSLPEAKIAGMGSTFGNVPSPSQLEGTAAFVQLDAFGGVKAEDFFGLDLQLNPGKAGLLLYGDGTPGAGAHLVLDPEIDFGAGAGAKVEASFGYVWLLDKSGGGNMIWNPEAPERVDFRDYWKTHIAELGVLFPINGARLPVPTEEEDEELRTAGKLTVRQALDAFAACELPLLSMPTTRVTLTGMADRPDTPARNQTLSENRANSVRNYLLGLVGKHTEDLESRVHAVGVGEPPEPPEPPGTKPTKKNKPQETFDPDFRRVDVLVESEADRTHATMARDARQKLKELDVPVLPTESTKAPLRQASRPRPK